VGIKSHSKKYQTLHKIRKINITWGKKKPAVEGIWTKKEGSGGMLEDAAK
jgi:hypothetical protein